MHTLLDYDCLLPELVNITDGKVSDNKAAFDIDIHPFIIVVADGGATAIMHCSIIGTATMYSLWCATGTICVILR